MKTSVLVFSGAASLSCLAALAGTASALPVPDVGNCNSPEKTCLTIDNTGDRGSGILSYGKVLGVHGHSGNNTGVIGSTYGGDEGSAGVKGLSFATDAAAIGVIGTTNNGNGTGVKGVSGAGFGVVGTTAGSGAGGSSAVAGVLGTSTASVGLGVKGQAGNGGTGVWGFARDGGYGVFGSTTGNGISVYGLNETGGYAGQFRGSLGVIGVPYAFQTTFTLWSDARLKKNVRPMAGALDRLLQLRGVTFEWKKPPGDFAGARGTQRGFIAQEVEKVFPEWVEERDGMKTVSARGFEALVVESMRALKRDNDELRKRVSTLEGDRGMGARAAIGDNLISLGGLLVLAAAWMISRRRRPGASV
jgi:hypothetical protein